MTGFYLGPATLADGQPLTVTVTDPESGAAVATQDNGIGGVAANLKPNRLYHVTISAPSGATVKLSLCFTPSEDDPTFYNRTVRIISTTII